jgi:hypothetical protein
VSWLWCYATYEFKGTCSFSIISSVLHLARCILHLSLNSVSSTAVQVTLFGLEALQDLMALEEDASSTGVCPALFVALPRASTAALMACR